MHQVDPKKNPGSIQFVKRGQIKNMTVLGPPTHSITLPQILQSLHHLDLTVILKVDIQGHECRVLRDPELFRTGYHIPFIFVEWEELVISQESCPDLGGFIKFLQGQGYTARWAVQLDHNLE